MDIGIGDNHICISEKQLSIMNRLRDLWQQHMYWTRSFIVSALAGLDDKEAVAQRLLRNPKDLANLLKQYYGNDKASEFESLLTEHLLLASNMLDAIIADDQKKAQSIREKWYDNAVEISQFLSSINPYWSEERWRLLFFEHLGMIDEIISLIMADQFVEEIAISDMSQTMMLGLADYMSAGIIKQFGI